METELKVGSMSREESFGEFVYDIFIYEKESGQKIPGRARLDTGMTCNAVSYSQAVMLGYPIEPYDGEPCIVANGSLYDPIGQVKLPFHFVNARNEHIWRIDFIVFPDGSPFDLCLGRRFISLANLLKRNPQVAPVEFRKLDPRKSYLIIPVPRGEIPWRYYSSWDLRAEAPIPKAWANPFTR